MMRSLGGVALTLLLVAGCGEKEPAACTAQTAQPCVCTTGATGTQICLTDGTWGACTCPVGDAGFSPYVPNDASRTARLDARASDDGGVGAAPH
jgi:hypothetical protein